MKAILFSRAACVIGAVGVPASIVAAAGAVSYLSYRWLVPYLPFPPLWLQVAILLATGAALPRLLRLVFIDLAVGTYVRCDNARMRRGQSTSVFGER